jgi:hypothetical protein
MRSRSRFILILSLILVLAAGWKLWLMARDVFPFNSDEAVVALMARHILGGERPTFFYGQAYMGSLDAYLVAACFAIFGQAVWVVRLLQSFLYLATILTTAAIGKVAFKSTQIGLLAALFLAIPAVNTTLYTTVSLGGYGEALLFGSLNLLTGFMILELLKNEPIPKKKVALLALLWGFLAGIGLWANGLTFVFSVPMGIGLLWSMFKQPSRLGGVWKSAGTAVLGFFVGALPWWLYAMQNGLNMLVTELFGNAVAVEQEVWLVRIWNHVINYAILGLTAAFGFRPPWEVRWLAIPLIPFIIAFLGLVFIYALRQGRRGSDHRLTFSVLGGVILVFSLAFLLTPFGVDPSGRYFLALTIPVTLAAAWFISTVLKSWRWQVAGVVLVLIFNAWGTLDCAAQFPPGITTQFNPISVVDQRAMPDLISFLQVNGATRGYTNYWVAYPLAYLSNEELVFTPRLPYQADLRYTPRDDRYAPYDGIVEGSSQPAFITTQAPALNDRLRSAFIGLGVTWEEKQIGDFQVFYHLSKTVRPEQLGLGL